MASDITNELLLDGLFETRKWYGVASIFGVMIVSAVVSIHAVAMGIFSQNEDMLTVQTTGSPFSYAVLPLEWPSFSKAHGKSEGLYGPRTSWVVAFSRSGSTSTQVLVQQVGKAVTSGPDFSLEPCHWGDIARGFHNCGDEMFSLVQCDFSKLHYCKEWGAVWRGSTTLSHWCCPEPYVPATASMRCSEALVRNFKTTSLQDLEQVIPNLESIPQLHVINLVRDPRGMYQSQKKGTTAYQSWFSLEPELQDLGFAHGNPLRNLNVLSPNLRTTRDNPDHLRRTCGKLASMMNVSHPQMLHVRFEDLISASDVAKNVISFLGYPWNRDVEQTSKKIFPGSSPDFTWAHINHYPGNAEETWSVREVAALNDAECQLASATWNYPLALEV